MTVVSDIKNIKNKRKKRKEEINMAYTPVEYPAEKGAFYALLKEQLEKYTENETDETAILANASAVLGIFRVSLRSAESAMARGSAAQAGQKSARSWWRMCIASPDILPVTVIPMQKSWCPC